MTKVLSTVSRKLNQMIRYFTQSNNFGKGYQNEHMGDVK